jgi:hypothetical protein
MLELEELRSKYTDRNLAGENLKKFLSEDLIPFARRNGFDFTEDEYSRNINFATNSITRNNKNKEVKKQLSRALKVTALTGLSSLVGLSSIEFPLNSLVAHAFGNEQQILDRIDGIEGLTITPEETVWNVPNTIDAETLEENFWNLYIYALYFKPRSFLINVNSSKEPEFKEALEKTVSKSYMKKKNIGIFVLPISATNPDVTTYRVEPSVKIGRSQVSEPMTQEGVTTWDASSIVDVTEFKNTVEFFLNKLLSGEIKKMFINTEGRIDLFRCLNNTIKRKEELKNIIRIGHDNFSLGSLVITVRGRDLTIPPNSSPTVTECASSNIGVRDILSYRTFSESGIISTDEEIYRDLFKLQEQVIDGRFDYVKITLPGKGSPRHGKIVEMLENFNSYSHDAVVMRKVYSSDTGSETKYALLPALYIKEGSRSVCVDGHMQDSSRQYKFDMGLKPEKFKKVLEFTLNAVNNGEIDGAEFVTGLGHNRAIGRSSTGAFFRDGVFLKQGVLHRVASEALETRKEELTYSHPRNKTSNALRLGSFFVTKRKTDEDIRQSSDGAAILSILSSSEKVRREGEDEEIWVGSIDLREKSKFSAFQPFFNDIASNLEKIAVPFKINIPLPSDVSLKESQDLMHMLRRQVTGVELRDNVIVISNLRVLLVSSESSLRELRQTINNGVLNFDGSAVDNATYLKIYIAVCRLIASGEISECRLIPPKTDHMADAIWQENRALKAGMKGIFASICSDSGKVFVKEKESDLLVLSDRKTQTSPSEWSIDLTNMSQQKVEEIINETESILADGASSISFTIQNDRSMHDEDRVRLYEAFSNWYSKKANYQQYVANDYVNSREYSVTVTKRERNFANDRRVTPSDRDGQSITYDCNNQSAKVVKATIGHWFDTVSPSQPESGLFLRFIDYREVRNILNQIPDNEQTRKYKISLAGDSIYIEPRIKFFASDNLLIFDTFGLKMDSVEKACENIAAVVGSREIREIFLVAPKGETLESKALSKLLNQWIKPRPTIRTGDQYVKLVQKKTKKRYPPASGRPLVAAAGANPPQASSRFGPFPDSGRPLVAAAGANPPPTSGSSITIDKSRVQSKIKIEKPGEGKKITITRPPPPPESPSTPTSTTDKKGG